MWGPGLIADQLAGTTNAQSVFRDLDVERAETATVVAPQPEAATRLDQALRAWNAGLARDGSDPAFVADGLPATPSAKPNILLLLVDDLKPALGCYGDRSARTPHIDALAAGGMRFESAYCNQAVCAPSRFTLMLGSHSTSTGLYGLGSNLRALQPDAITLPQHFARHGSTAPNHSGRSYWDLFDPATLPFPAFEELPAGAPRGAGKRGGEIAAYAPVPENGTPDAALKRQLIHGYYASTSYVDAQIGKVLAELDRLDLAENTIVVLWGDHGFHLGDRGIWTKHTNYEQANRIPLLIRAPGVTTPNSATRQLAESVDVFPTLA